MSLFMKLLFRRNFNESNLDTSAATSLVKDSEASLFVPLAQDDSLDDSHAENVIIESRSIYVLMIVLPIGFGCMALSLLLVLFLMGWVQMIKYDREMAITITTNTQNITETEGTQLQLVLSDDAGSMEKTQVNGSLKGNRQATICPPL